jgi:hypothetical protein
MTRVLTHSDEYLIRSDEHSRFTFNDPTQTSPRTGASTAADRTGAARFAVRDVQALRSAELSLRRRTRARSQTISLHQPAWSTPADRLRAECSERPSRQVPRQLSQSAGHAQRDLRDQRRTAAAARGFRIDGSGRRRSRLRQGGRHPRQYDRILSCRRRLAVRTGGARR